MNKLVATIALAVSMIGMATAQIKFGAPRAPKSNSVSAQSSTVTWDSSLLKGVVFFDNLDDSYGALNYDLAQLDGLLPGPLRFGMASAMKSQNEVWGGLSVSYTPWSSEKGSLGFLLAVPGVRFENDNLKWSQTRRVVPGVMFSVKF